jgi:aspartate dehydrogenase
VAELLEDPPDAVAEAAGHEAVRRYGPPILDFGIDLFAVSSGALADDALCARLEAGALASGARLFVPAGAIAGIDGLCALRHAGLSEVLYVSTKPPSAWKDTPADGLFDLDALAEPTTIFRGTAREAARAFPKNANLAATVALAGIGFERTEVRLVADPSAHGNSGRIEARSAAGDLLVEMRGPASANPKTSASTAYSLVRALERHAAEIVLPGDRAP